MKSLTMKKFLPMKFLFIKPILFKLIMMLSLVVMIQALGAVGVYASTVNSREIGRNCGNSSGVRLLAQTNPMKTSSTDSVNYSKNSSHSTSVSSGSKGLQMKRGVR